MGYAKRLSVDEARHVATWGLRRVRAAVRWRSVRLTRRVLLGVPSRWLGYRWVRQETLREHMTRRGRHDRIEVVHPPEVAHHPLPCNVASRDDLPDDAGWWGYSFRDVPERVSGETLLASVGDCRVVCYRDPTMGDDFYPALLTSDDRALQLRELRFRPRHAEVLRSSGPPVQLDHATWIIERVYHNHSHWLTAHLPKLLLLQQRGELDDVLLPPERTPTMDGSLRMLGLEPDDFPSFDPTRPLQVGSLTVLETDRFRPELLRLVQQAFGRIAVGAPPASRRIYVSRLGATRRRLVNEEEIWPSLEDAGFERVLMEALSFEEQVKLMRSTSVLVAPHGAGLTNMLFCRAGVDVVEIADLSFPNPNFYAVASAVGHRYWLIGAEGLGDQHPLERDLRVDPDALQRVLDDIG